MLRSCTLFILLTFTAQVRAKDSMDDLVDEMVMKLSDRLNGSPSQHTDMDNTVFAKPGQLAAPSSRLAPLYALPKVRASQAPSTLRAPNKAKLFQPEKESSWVAQLPKVEGVAPEYQEMAQGLLKDGTWKAMAQASDALVKDVEEAEKVPYSIEIFVHGGKFGEDGKIGSASIKYMETRIESALKNVENNIQSVGVRVNIEGQDPKTYHIETTVKMKRSGTIALSNPKNSEQSFVEAVDHMHDTLKYKMTKEKERRGWKQQGKRRYNRRNGEAPAPGEGAIDDNDDDVYGYGSDDTIEATGKP